MDEVLCTRGGVYLSGLRQQGVNNVGTPKNELFFTALIIPQMHYRNS